MKFSAACALAIALLTVSGCGGDEDGDGAPVGPDASANEADAAPLSASCVEAMDKSDILWIQDNVFNSCAAFSVCHQGAAMSAGGLNLESGFAEAALINIDSQLFPDYKLVVPGDPDNSYLMTILGAAEGPLKDGVGTMPYNNPTLCEPKLDAIGRWITALPQ